MIFIEKKKEKGGKEGDGEEEEASLSKNMYVPGIFLVLKLLLAKIFMGLAPLVMQVSTFMSPLQR